MSQTNVINKDLINKCNRRILLSRMRILMNHGFYGLLLMHMRFALDSSIDTAATDGMKIYFSPDFMEELSDSELDFVLMHEIMHVALCHCFRGLEHDQQLFNIACDIVVNSNILYSNNMDVKSITISKYGVSMNKTPLNDDGYKYTAEEVYDMLVNKGKIKSNSKNANGSNSQSSSSAGTSTSSKKDGKRGKVGSSGEESDLDDDLQKQKGWDSHEKWSTLSEDKKAREEWIKRVIDAATSIYITESSNNRGNIPLFAKRIVDEFKNPQTDWRRLLDEFISEEVCDYSFNPPDKRYEDSPFYLPDFNDTDIEISDILFMIDTSGSVNDKALTVAYSEIKGAIDQYDGKLKGWLGFFDAAVVDPIPFSDVEELKKIKAYGGGGTSFHCIFDYIKDYMHDNFPKTLVILTDGYAPFPDIEETMGIPVLWLIDNDKVTPPWGKVARLKIDNN